MFFTQIIRRFVLVALVFSAPLLAADHNDTPPALDPVVKAQSDVSGAVVPVESMQGKKSMAAKIFKTALQAGFSAVGLVAIIDALVNSSGETMVIQTGIGVMALMVSALMSVSRDSGSYSVSHDCSCTHDDHYYHDYYNHGTCYLDPIVVSHDDVQQPAVIYNHQHVEIIQPVVVQNSVAVQTDPVIVQPATPSVNADNVEVNKFWNDPFNY